MAQYGNTNDTSGYAEAFYNAYQAGYEHILQEVTDVYGSVVRNESIEGEHKAYDFLGSIELTKKTQRFADVPVDELDHNRRWVSPSWYRKGIYVDSEDQIMMHTDPTGDYMKALAKAVVRTKNDVIYNAFTATVQGGTEYGDDTYTFDVTDEYTKGGRYRAIVHDVQNDFTAGGTSTGLTIEKLILAREALVDLKNDANQMFNLACSQKQISDLYREAETQSIDTSAFKSLAEGRMPEFMGFRFLIDYNITASTASSIDGTSVYPCYAFTNDAILYAQHLAPMFTVDWIPTKQVWMVYCSIGMGAIRMDEDQVIKIECA